MATVLCTRCGGKIPLTARSCPHCGARPHRTGTPQAWLPSPRRRFATLAGVVIALLIVAALVWALLVSRRSPLEEPPPVVPTEPR